MKCEQIEPAQGMPTDEEIKQITTDFFRYWWNTSGNNTDQGFDEWWKLNKQNYKSRLAPKEELRKELLEFAIMLNTSLPLKYGIKEKDIDKYLKISK